ncbi:MAG TPA: hypothetical protein VFC07_14850 [Verrucomicrobiae bacterium]|nr:hypothetical protein [Verrucomicrobiae bacterium]
MNPRLGGWDGHAVQWMLCDIHYMRRYIPAGWLGLSVLYSGFHLDPHGYHLANVVMHGINAVLVFLVCRRFVVKFGPKVNQSSWIAFSPAIAAIWWAIHPLKAETVAWASGYLYTQAGFFFLISLHVYLSDTRLPAGAKNGISAIFFILSLASYPLMLGYPAALFCYEAYQSRQDAGGMGMVWRGPGGRRLLAVLGWFGLPAILFGGITVYASYHATEFWGQAESVRTAGLVDLCARALYGWGYYLWKACWPYPLKVVPDALPDPAWGGEGFWLCLAMLGGAVYFCFFRRRSRRSGFWAVGAAYLFLLVPTLGLTEKTHFVSDRYSYLTMLPLAIAIALGLAVWPRVRVHRGAGLAAVLLLGGLGLMARWQITPWSDSETFFNRALGESSAPGKEMEHIYLMTINLYQITGRYKQARATCAAGLRRFPASTILKQKENEIGLMEIGAVRQAAELGLTTPVCELALAHVAIADSKSARAEWPEAADHLRAALDVAPQYYPARMKLAEVLALQEKPEEALACYLRAHAEAGGRIKGAESAHFLFLLTSACAEAGNARLAHMAFDKALELSGRVHR